MTPNRPMNKAKCAVGRPSQTFQRKYGLDYLRRSHFQLGRSLRLLRRSHSYRRPRHHHLEARHLHQRRISKYRVVPNFFSDLLCERQSKVSEQKM